jgi:alkaline phosphatase
MRIRRLVFLCAAGAALLSAQQRAKNVILFLGDAGGLSALNAASIYGYGAPLKLFVQRMPHVALSETSSSSSWVTDSAAGMTAIVTGQKTKNGVVSQSFPKGGNLKTILEYAEEHGLSTGVVSNSPMADATPAACYAHADSRKKTGEIFAQVWKPLFGDGVDVVIGPGRKQIMTSVSELGLDIEKELKASGRQLYSSLAEVPKDARRAVVLVDNPDFDVAAAADKALEILSRNPKGFFLMVESDLHTDNPKRGLERAVAFDRYIGQTAGRLRNDRTLILFTADHSFDVRVRSGAPGQPLTLPATEKGAPEPAVKPNVRMENGHTGEEVLVAAQGPGSERVRGFLSNTDLFRIMLAAYGWQPPKISD